MNTIRFITLKQQVLGAALATVMTVAMFSGIGALAAPSLHNDGIDAGINAGVDAAAQIQPVRG